MSRLRKIILVSQEQNDLAHYEQFVANKRGETTSIASIGELPIERCDDLNALHSLLAKEHFDLHIAFTRRLTETYQSATNRLNSPIRILAVDDKTWVCDYLKTNLGFQRLMLPDLKTGEQVLVLIRDINREVDSASDTKTAVALFKKEMYQFVFTDLWMPTEQFMAVNRLYHWDSPSVVVEATDLELKEGSQGMNLIKEVVSFSDKRGVPRPQIIPFSSYWENPRIRQLFADKVYKLCHIGIMPKHYGFEFIHRNTFDEVLNSILLNPDLTPSTYNTFLSILRFGIEETKLRKSAIANFISLQSKLIGESKDLLRIKKEIIEKVARSALTVLLIGESGTGKDVIATLIHEYSPRKDKPFVAINCAAIPPELLESELFGHEKGAFTGATSLKHGLVELAEGGTLFLDEIGEMGLHLQAKLLRVLETRSFRRVGGLNEQPLNVRVVAASMRDLRIESEKKRFQEALYFRLRQVEYRIPPLRERKEDILALANHFIKQAPGELGVTELPLSANAKEFLLSYAWPGNVRELKNAIQTALTVATSDEILPEDFRTGSRDTKNVYPSGAAHFKQAKDDLIKRYCLMALRETGNKKRHAAPLLGVSRTTFDEYLERSGINLTIQLNQESDEEDIGQELGEADT